MLQFGDARLITGLGGAFAGKGVDEGGLADVGDAANQHPHRLDHAAAVRRELKAGLDERLGGRADTGVERDGAGAALRVVMGQPLHGALRVGQVLFVENF